jgi:hypothetical protein
MSEEEEVKDLLNEVKDDLEADDPVKFNFL